MSVQAFPRRINRAARVLDGGKVSTVTVKAIKAKDVGGQVP